MDIPYSSLFKHDSVRVILISIWLLLPIFVSRYASVIAGGDSPVDNGQVLIVNRILGNGVTWRGTIASVCVGVACVILVDLLFYQVLSSIEWSLPRFSIKATFGIPLGSTLGDIVASFFKRRFGYRSGDDVPILDQLDSVIGAFELTTVLDPTWMSSVISVEYFLFMCLLSLIIHVVGSRILFARNKLEFDRFDESERF